MAVEVKKGDGQGWVGRSIRRVEDPTLVAGNGRFTGDLPAARWVRFVRSSVAAGRIKRITAPEGATVVTAAELSAVRPIQPMLHKFNYVPISQPVLAKAVVRFVGEPIAAVVALTKEEAEDIADLVEVEIDDTPAIVGARAALAPGARLVHDEAAGNVVVEGRLKTPGFDAKLASAHRRIKVDIRSHRQNALPMEPRAAHAAWDAASERVTLTCATQMPHAMRTIIADLIGMPESDLRVIAPDVGGGFGQKMSLAPEFVVVTWLARKLRTSVAWVEDRRENLVACFHSRDQSVSLRGCIRRRCQADRPCRRHRRRCRSLFLLSDDLRRRAVDGDGGDARSLRRARICLHIARGRDQHLSDGAISRRLASGDHVHARAADGQGGDGFRPRPGRDPSPQPGQDVSLHVGDRPGVRRGDAMSKPWTWPSQPSACRRSAPAR